ncbi:MAG: PLP-dependent aminotransferase family protein [Spirochaetes bacterium]|nr:MAG: PLP-dependent aminotransferase family protein [Spirochaetota bacterium]
MPRIAPYLSVGTINLDRSAPIPLHRQLYRALREKILTNVILPGERLPSSRVLAEELSLGRNTVVNAYNQLIAEGFLDSAVGSGTIVSTDLPEELTGTTAFSDNLDDLSRGPGKRDIRISERGIALNDVPFLEETRLKPFTPAYPFIDERFVTVWGSLMSKAWRRMTRNQFGYPSALGYYPLREAIASYLRMARGVKCVSQQVIITDGAQQALNLTAQLLLNPGESVWIEDPSYDGAKAAFRNVPARIVPVPIDSSGLMIDTALKTDPTAKLAYISPSNQFPLGITMDLNRRLQLINWAEENSAWIIEDDYDSEFRYGGPPVMSLQGIDRSERVIYVGTFSKVLYPGLRLGYMVAPADLIEPIHAMRAHADRGSPLFEQIVLNDYIREGHFARHIRRMRKLYSERRLALIEAIKKHLGEMLELSDGEAGLHIVARLPEGVDDEQLSMALRTRGYEVPCLSSYSILKPKVGGLLFGFTALEVSEMDDAISRIRPVLLDAVSRVPSG